MIYKRLLPYVKIHKKDLIIGTISLILADIFGLMIPWMIRYPIDIVQQDSHSKTILPYIATIIFLAFTQSFFRFIWRRNIYGFSRKVEYGIRKDFFSHLQTLSCSFLQTNKTGDLMSRATNDIKAIRDFCSMGILILVDSSIILSISVILMLFIDTKLTLIALTPLPIVTAIVFLLKKEMRKKFKAVQDKLAALSAAFRETIEGIRVIKAYVQEETRNKNFYSLCREFFFKNLDSAKISALFTPLLMLTIGLSYALTLWIGGGKVISKQISLGEFVSFNGYLALLTWPMAGIGIMVNITQRAMASVSRIEEIMNIPPSLPPYTAKKTGQWNLKEDIKIDNLTFTYDKTKKIILTIPRLTIPGRTLTVITGSIGSGKSTLASLFPCLYPTYTGTISIGGDEIRKIPSSFLRKNIGFVEQDPFLFSDTIKKNIAFGVEDAKEEDIRKAIEIAHLKEEIERFPKKDETTIGERGITLSGGQKQRVAIARAVIKNPDILILDDAFSNLDQKTEEKILQKIVSFLPDTTTIIVTHRLSSVKGTDLIIVMQEGKVEECGSHAELIKKQGAYYSLYQLQMFGLDK